MEQLQALFTSEHPFVDLLPLSEEIKKLFAVFCGSAIIGPLQLAIHVLKNRRAGEQKSHWDKTNKRHT